MGFCLLNNVAIAARELQKRGISERIMIVDWDIHHGNGTQKIFVEDPSVLFISIHRFDNGKFYPQNPEESSPDFVGLSLARGKTVNIAWNGGGMGDADYLAAFHRVILPIANDFKPNFVFVSAGFDAAEGDPIGECKVTPTGFAQMTHLLLGVAEKGKVLLVLEGGYNIPVVANCAEACMRTLLGEAPIDHHFTETTSQVSQIALRAITSTIKAQSGFWQSLSPKYYPMKTLGDSNSQLITFQRKLKIYSLFLFT